MANICDNKCYIYSENENMLSDITSLLEENLNDLDIYSFDDEYIECYFTSKWTFPTETFKKITNILKIQYDISDLYIRVLSEEFGCDYVALNIFTDNEWKDEQTFNF